MFDISILVGFLIYGVLFLIMLVLVPLIARKSPTIALLIAKLVIPQLVYGAEKYLTLKSGEDKRTYVLTLFDKLKLNVDPDVIRLILEAACERLDIEQGKYGTVLLSQVESLVGTVVPEKETDTET